MTYKSKDDYLKKHNGYNYIFYRCRANLHNRFDLSSYPWDKQIISISIEDENQEINDLVYIPDTDNSNIYKGLIIGDWSLGKSKAYVTNNVYETNFGQPEKSRNEKSTYARFKFELPIEHRGLNIYIKTFLALFISVAIAFLTFFIRPENYSSPRFSVAITGMFGAVSSYVVVSQRISESPYLTLADYIHFTGMFFIFLSLVESCVVLIFHHKNMEHISRPLDLWSRYTVPAFFILTVIILSFLNK